MNVLKIIHCFPPESMTGSEIYACNLSKTLSKDHKVSVFYRINNRNFKEYKVIKDRHNGFDVYKINNTLRHYRSLQGIYKNKEIEKRFSEFLDEVRPDIVHIHHLLFLSIDIIDEIKKRNIPIIFTLHDYWLVCPRGQLLKNNLKVCDKPMDSNCTFCLASGLNLRNFLRKLVRFSMRGGFLKNKGMDIKEIFEKVNLFISPSRFLRGRFIEFGMPPEKIIYSDNGMDLSLFKDIKKTRSDKVRFGFIGTLIPSKGVHVLIKAFNRIKGNKAALKIYGKAPNNNGIFDYHDRIKGMARGNRNIRFTGAFHNKDVARIFSEIDVLVFPSIWPENSPLTIQEAIITKTPVVASDIGGIPEMVKDGVNGLLFTPGDIYDLRQKLEYIIQNPNFLHRWREGIPEVKDIEDNARELEKIYSSLLKLRQETICQH